MASDVIKEFLVGLGFKIDQSKYDKFQTTLDGATAKAVAFGEAMYEVAEKVAQAVADVIPQLDSLYWQSQRLGSSAGDIKAFGYAFTQLGGSAQGAQATLEGLAEFAKSSPGAGRFLERLGVSPKDFGDATATAHDLANAFRQMPYFRAKAYASVLGIDPLSLQALMRDQGQYEAQYKRFARNLGINLDEAAGKSNEFMTRLREMKAEFGLMFDFATLKVLDWILPKLEALARWVTDMSSGKKLEGISGHLQDILNDVGDLLKALERLAASPAIQRFGDELAQAIDHALKSLVHLVRLVTDVLNGDWKAARADAGATVSDAGAAVGAVGTGIGDLAAGAAGAFKKNVPENAQTAVRFFRSQGMTDVQARGTTAMLFSESHLDPNSVNPTSGARGLGQWLGDRAKQFRALFHHGLEQSTFMEQLQFVVYELKHGERAAWNRMKDGVSAFGVANEGIHSYERPGFVGELGDAARAAALLSSDIFDTKLGNAKANAAALGGGASAKLGTDGAKSLTINQKTDIHVHGNDNKQLAQDVTDQQDSVNQRLIANTGVFAF